MINLLCFFTFGVVIFRLYEVLILPTFFYYALKGKIAKKYNFSILLLLTFCILYAITNSKNFNESIVLQFKNAITYILLFIIGKTVAENNPLEPKKYNNYVIVLTCGLLLHATLNVWETVSMNEWGVTPYIYDFWTKNITLSTYESTLFTMAIGMAFSFLFVKRRILRLAGIGIIIFEIIVALKIGSRAMTSELIIIAILAIVILLISSQRSKRFKRRFLLAVAFVILFAFSLYISNSFDIKDYIKESYLMTRFDLQHSQESGLFDNTSRSLFYDEVLSQIFVYPFGGMTLSYDVSAHNTFLDIIRVGGIIPFLIFVMFVVNIGVKLLKCIKRIGLFDSRILLVSLVFIIIVFNSMVESIFSLNPTLMYGFMLVCGIIDAIYVNLKRYST